ncbi:MAG: PEP-CTERM sorting domain-containing protein [Planctomycetota bacterium]
MDGWTFDGTIGSGDFFWESIGGNPGGYLQSIDLVGFQGEAIAPAKFLGDWSSLDESGQLSFDHRLFTIGNAISSFAPFSATISGPGGSAIWVADEVFMAPTDWVSFQVPIAESSWTVQSGTWGALLADVQELRFPTETISNNDGNSGDNTGLDNVILSAIPEPTSLLLAAISIIGLSIRRR